MSDPLPIRVGDAALAAGDPTRRFAVDVAGMPFFPGLTRPEAEAVCAWVGDGDPVRALVPVDLGVVVSDGAGPHLLDSAGGLVLVLGPHSHVDGIRVAMGAPSPLHAVGAVEQVATCRYRWIARRDVPGAARVDVLNALDLCVDRQALVAWECEAGGGRRPT